MKKWFIIILVVIILAGGIVGLGYYFFEIRPVAIVLLKTDIDPLTAIRGRTIALDYEISQIAFSLLKDANPEDIQAGWFNCDIYVVLEKKNKYWQAVSAYKYKPRKKGVVFVWGRCNSKLHNKFYVRYNIFSLSLNEKNAKIINELKQQLLNEAKTSGKSLKSLMKVDVEVIINWQGKARIKKLLINDESYYII